MTADDDGDQMDACACLPTYSVSTLGLMTLLARWAFVSCKHQNGLSTMKEKDSAKELFICLLSAGTDDIVDPLELSVQLTSQWDSVVEYVRDGLRQ